jgi:hypothetical protein
MKRLIAKYPEGYEVYERKIALGVTRGADVGMRTTSKESYVE